jgi:hypothetical protein
VLPFMKWITEIEKYDESKVRVIIFGDIPAANTQAFLNVLPGISHGQGVWVTVQVLFSKCEEVVVTVWILFTGQPPALLQVGSHKSPRSSTYSYRPYF